MSHVDGATAGAARRRRERRLRMHWRHEQLSLQMLLATFQHHSAPRGQTTATNGGEARVALHGQVTEAPLSQGSQPAPLSEVAGWQSRVSRHTVDQIVDAVLGLPTLDGPVPLVVEQLVDVLQLFDALIPVAKQVIDVPKIFIERIPPRTSVREPQLAEQLVEVPTIVSFSSLQRIMEQTVDIPAPRGRGHRGGLQDFSHDRVQQLLLTLDIPVLRGDLQGFFPGQGSTASSSHSVASDGASQGVFRTFLHGEKCGVPGRSVRTCPGTSAHGPRRLMCSPGGSMRSSWRRRRRRTRATFRLSVLPFLLPTAPGHCVQSACGWGRHQRGRWKDVYLPVFSFGARGGLPCLLLRQGARCLWLDEGLP